MAAFVASRAGGLVVVSRRGDPSRAAAARSVGRGGPVPGARAIAPRFSEPRRLGAALRVRASASGQAPEDPGTSDGADGVKCDLSTFPGVSFFRVEALVRPWRLPNIVASLTESGIRGLTVTEVRGMGLQLGAGYLKERYLGIEYGDHDLVQKMRLEVVVVAKQVDSVVNVIVGSASTGEVGDGKIFISPVSDVVRIRTGETGAVAEHMAGGMEDMVQDPKRLSLGEIKLDQEAFGQ